MKASLWAVPILASIVFLQMFGFGCSPTQVEPPPGPAASADVYLVTASGDKFITKVKSIKTAPTAAKFYGPRVVRAYRGGGALTFSELIPKTSHIFFADAFDGLALFVVHGPRGFSANTQVKLSKGPPTDFQARDGPPDTYEEDDASLTYTTGHVVDFPRLTDGYVLSPISVPRTLTVTLSGTSGLASWKVYDAATNSFIQISDLVDGKSVKARFNISRQP